MLHRRLILGSALLALGATGARGNDATDAVDALEAVFGKHPGARRAHAKGRLYDGRFTPAPIAASLSRAPQFAAPTGLVLRFSDGAGIPDIPDGHPAAVPAGLALRFQTPGGGSNDIVANANEGFPVRNLTDFIGFLRAVAASGPGVAQPTPLAQFVAAHPETQAFLARPHPSAASFATTRYYGNNAFYLVAADGTRRAFRSVIEPVAGVATLDAAAAAARPPDALFDDLAQRLGTGPVRFNLVAQMAAPGDPTNDVTMLWPAERERIILGTIEVTAVAANQAAEQLLFFNPNNLPDGIQPSDDPILPARIGTYAVSIARRLGR